MTKRSTANQKSFSWFSPPGLAALGFIGAVSYFLFIEHRHHILPLLPYLILLLCPLLHVLMHRGHSGRHTDSAEQEAYRRGLEEGRRQTKQKRLD